MGQFAMNENVVVVIPGLAVAVIDLYHAHAVLHQAPGHQTAASEIMVAVTAADGFGLFGDIQDFRRLALHPSSLLLWRRSPVPSFAVGGRAHRAVLAAVCGRTRQMAALRAHLADVVHAHVETARRTRLRVPAQRGAIFGERCQPTFLGPATPGWCHCGDSLSLFYHRPGRDASNRMLRYFGSQNGTNASATDAFAPCREHCGVTRPPAQRPAAIGRRPGLDGSALPARLDRSRRGPRSRPRGPHL